MSSSLKSTTNMTTTVRQIWISFGEIDKRCCETKYLLYFFYCVVFCVVQCSVVSNSCTNSNDKVNTNAGGLGDFVIGLTRIYFVFRRNIYRSLARRLLTSWLYIVPN